MAALSPQAGGRCPPAVTDLALPGTQEFRLRPGAVAVPGDSDRPLTGQRDRASPISEPSLGCRESDSRFHFGPAELLPVLPEGAAGMGFRLVHAQSALSRAFQSLVRRGIAKV